MRMEIDSRICRLVGKGERPAIPDVDVAVGIGARDTAGIAAAIDDAVDAIDLKVYGLICVATRRILPVSLHVSALEGPPTLGGPEVVELPHPTENTRPRLERSIRPQRIVLLSLILPELIRRQSCHIDIRALLVAGVGR
jgi:hypothetical protein